ncbi:MAG: 3-methylmercaptopropionyl-CoA dehydrogenase [Pseudomonadales bacterium]|nr:3-methylmercaptopropionyl-CoA dehydrogenase [Pseudomonadales bacterium]
MSEFRPPVDDIGFVLAEHAAIADLARLPGLGEATPEIVAAVLDGAAQLTAQVIAPLNRSGDREGARIENGQVVEAAGFGEAYRQYVEGGWNSVPFAPRHGGQGLPLVLATAVQEMVQTANLAFSLCPLLTQGAIDALSQHADEELQRVYLSKMVSGEWTGTMNLTEPQAGSDLAAVRTRAERDGRQYRISGSKIFITWGDHGMTANVIHLVLARLPDAPPGVKGISLFLVPKFLVNADGSLGERNDVWPVSVEHKLGIHASPTCVMSFGEHGGAIGYLVGRENEGLACMFTMMNHARISVGLQGVAVSERARQQAVAYARQRVQGAAPGAPARVAIVQHPDVRRMLLQMRALTEAARALVYVAMAEQDRIHHHGDAGARAAAAARIALLTPIVKGWCTEMALEVTSLGVQVHGGMGYIEETGAAQHLRDARILPIYEGTNGIQALDLIGRKFLRDGGRALQALVAEMRDVAATLDNGPLADIGSRLEQAIAELESTAAWIAEQADADGVLPATVAYHFLMLAGTVAGGWQLAVAARAAARRLATGGDDEAFCNTKLVTARFYAEQILPRARMHAEVVRAGAEAVMALDEALLA